MYISLENSTLNASELEHIARSVNSYVLVVNRQGAILWANNSFCNGTGYDSDEVVGKNIASLLVGTETPAVKQKELDHAIHSGQPFRGILQHYTKNKRLFWHEISMESLGGNEKSLIIGEDITERIKVNEELFYSEARWKFALEESGDGYFEYDYQYDSFYGSSNLLAALGLSIAGARINYHRLVELIHPDDMTTAVSSLFDLLDGKVKIAKHELRVKDKNSRYRWLLIRATLSQNKLESPPSILGVATDISQIKKTEKALIKAKRKAEKASAYKNQFLSSISHEIRTPLNAIIGLSGLLKQKASHPDLKEDLDSLSFSADHLLALINDVLDLSKIEAGKVIFQQQVFSLRETINEVAQMFKSRCQEKGIALLMEISPDMPEFVKGDQMRLIQVLNNLVNNAVKFTENGSVSIGARVLEKNKKTIKILFEIKDTGIGIEAKNQKRIFNSFEQATSETTARYGGTGLGLSISKSLVELQGGNMGLESSYGKGSTFYFSLPLEPAEAPFRTFEKQKDHDLGNVKILVADDVKINQKVMMAYLKNWKAQPIPVNNGEEALKLVEQQDVDLIIMDIYMPIMDGFQAIKQIRKTERGKKLPIIALTASAETSIIDKALKLGANECLTKPINTSQLLSAIYRLLNLQDPSLRANIPLSKPSAYIDLSRLQEASLGSREFMLEMLDILKQEIPQTFEQCDAALAAGHYEDFALGIHKLKNTLLMLGFDDYKPIIVDLEQVARGNGDKSSLEGNYQKLLNAWQIAKIELDNLAL
ncbi:MAG: ATP-binding protein [Chitinophagales bacterium]|nr:ATP-binding protein [Chitinophagales bacterium]